MTQAHLYGMIKKSKILTDRLRKGEEKVSTTNGKHSKKKIMVICCNNVIPMYWYLLLRSDTVSEATHLPPVTGWLMLCSNTFQISLLCSVHEYSIYKLFNKKTFSFDILNFTGRLLRDLFIIVFTHCYTAVNTFSDKRWKAACTYST